MENDDVCLLPSFRPSFVFGQKVERAKREKKEKARGKVSSWDCRCSSKRKAKQGTTHDERSERVWMET